eukprot:PhF_6_TR12255/c0_g1_i1/m.19419
MTSALYEYVSYVEENKFLCWGLLPSLCVAISFTTIIGLMELLIRIPFMQRYMIVYGKDKKPRNEWIAQTQQKVPFTTQLRSSMISVWGPLNLLSATVNAYLFDFVVGPPDTVFPSLTTFAVQICLMALVADFFLYWGHRVQHMNEYLWKNCHSVHHTLATPTSAGTAYINDIDTILQAASSIIGCCLVVRPHPVAFWLYCGFHVGNNALNHSGLDCWWLNILTLKVLPFRCSNTLHDAHHRYSNYGKNAKNFAEMFWIWDYVFGTLSTTANTLAHCQG